MIDILSLPLAKIAILLGEGKLKARDLVEAAIANHERFGGKLMAYSQWAPAHARRCADAADAVFAAGPRAGPLQGIPTSIKDLFAVSGFPTCAGSPKPLPAKFEIEGPVVAALRQQLASVMGKTHMVEFAFGGTGQNAHYGSPYNPWDAKAHRSPGGSSSGAGVSLCEGSALLAFGSDTAASVRLPAAMTGNAGLKITKDRWSTEGIVPLSFTFDTPGILTRSMADAAFAFAALDPSLGDSFAFMRRVPASVGGIRIGVADSWFWADCENGIDEIIRAAIEKLARAGAVLKETPLPEAREAYAVFSEGGVSAIELRAFLDRELPDWLATIDPVNAPALKKAETLSAREYLSRRLRLQTAAQSAAARFDDVDVIATPTVMFTPHVLAEETGAEKFWARNRKIVHNLVPVNYLTLCAATLPVGLDRLGMPVGLQLIAKGGDDERLVAIACAAERVLGAPRDILGVPPMCRG
ncbi:MAG TPA: amidase [Xanthobacteraceae bacterium]|jgi:aspartyl-tRNA(Asn)/glutamyl-tRNA(Gln) amidotransferase subunit A|nr:amidase [Xanthobacteraceae bacterium]